MKKRVVKILISLVVFVIAIATNEVMIEIPIVEFNISCSLVLFIVSYLTVGMEILKKAFRNIKRGKVFDENFLMTVATLGAFAIGEFSEAVAVMLFYQVGEAFQKFAVDKSRKSITDLMDIRPDVANLVKGDEVVGVNPADVEINDIILIKPGEKVPLDGCVVEGESMLDTKALTGEAVPRKVCVNDVILSGCINQNGVIKIKVEKKFGESTVSKILDLVQNASSEKSKSENFITKFAKYYTPIVVGIAVFLAVVPPVILKGATFFDWIYRALSFLVVSCPCALVISIPMSFFGGIGRCSKEGILVKGSNYLEVLADVKIGVFDKTGTLTEGVFDVQEIVTSNMDENEFLDLVAHAECYSTHPIADSIRKRFGKELAEERISNVEDIVGHGISAMVDGRRILAGNSKLMDKFSIDFEKQNRVETIIYVAVDNCFCGYIVIADKIKADSKIAINRLRKNGVNRLIMLTGDKKEVGEDVAAKLDMDEVCADLLPTDKVEIVRDIIAEKKAEDKFFFVGDGINDAPVLSLADVGIAMGGLGSDAAVEAADVVIMTDEPSRIADAIKVSRKTLRIVKENIYFAIGVKVLVLILASMGFSTMWMAVFADVGVSVLATLNSLRMLIGR